VPAGAPLNQPDSVAIAAGSSRSVVIDVWPRRPQVRNDGVQLAAPRLLPLAPALAAEHVEVEPQVLRQADEPRALLLYPLQRVDPDRVGRDQLVELEICLRRLRAGGEQVGNVRVAEAAGQTDDEPRILAAAVNSAEHGSAPRKT
jgi:hypothetical protein